VSAASVGVSCGRDGVLVGDLSTWLRTTRRGFDNSARFCRAAFARLVAGDVRFRFVIDISTLADGRQDQVGSVLGA
jgi:hypothetical protein